MTASFDSKHKDMPKTSPPALVINENGATLGERRLHRISPNLNDGASAWIHSVTFKPFTLKREIADNGRTLNLGTASVHPDRRADCHVGCFGSISRVIR